MGHSTWVTLQGTACTSRAEETPLLQPSGDKKVLEGSPDLFLLLFLSCPRRRARQDGDRDRSEGKAFAGDVGMEPAPSHTLPQANSNLRA